MTLIASWTDQKNLLNNYQVKFELWCSIKMVSWLLDNMQNMKHCQVGKTIIHFKHLFPPFLRKKPEDNHIYPQLCGTEYDWHPVHIELPNCTLQMIWY